MANPPKRKVNAVLGRTLLNHRIRARLLDELPSYMVPRYLAIFDDFPKLSSGKADRKALTSILTVRMTKEAEEVVTTHGN